MASVLVDIERDGNRPALASCEALDEGRPMATRLGATGDPGEAHLCRGGLRPS